MARGDGQGIFGGNSGRGQGIGRSGGRGRMGGLGKGEGGSCVCPQCGKTITHQLGTPCNKIKCPVCGSLMMRND